MILSNSLEQWVARKWDERDARNRAVGLAEGEKKGRAIGVEEGEKKGMAIGLEEGRAVERAEWEDKFAELRDWNDRRLEAESRGETFDEPMPGSDNGSVRIEED